MARSLGVPMVAALGDAVLATANGDALVVDGTAGAIVVHPGPAALERFRLIAAENAAEQARLAAGRGRPCLTATGKRIRLLANASTPAEVTTALERGAEGVGLVRTELAFLDATGWPSTEQHLAALAPTLEPLVDRIATVRTLDFGADKTPAFLRGSGGRGIALMLEHEDALEAQLAAIVQAGAGTRLRIMLPLVESPEQLVAARRLLRRVTASDRTPPQLGAMIETPAGAKRSHELALVADFFSIGTNDLVATTLGLDRDQPEASPLRAADPRVLELMRRAVASAHAVGITVEVCGEAAGEPELTPLLVGLGIDELSVSPARLDAIRDAVGRSGELGDELRELRDRRGGVVA
jgi:phosphoenolpyruvate-protein kinase (PTS system EI component)